MNTYKTDMDKKRSVAEMLLCLEIYPTEINFVASHPFTNIFFTAIQSDGKFEMIDLHEEESANRWRAALKEQIEKSSLRGILLLMNWPYVLLFLKMIQDSISPSDMGEALSLSWSMIENISTDCNVTSEEIIKMFLYASKKTLMTDSERKTLSELPNEVTVFRGVTGFNKKNRKAVSYTLDRETAEWFANRYQKGDGEIWELTVPKERILCFFEGRNESEVILNLSQDDEKKIQIISKNDM